MRRWRRSIGGTLLAALLAATSGGGGEQRCGHLHAARAAAESFDTHGGRDARVYPRSPRVDYRHLKLDLRFEDLTSRRFGAVQTIDFETLALPVESLDLDGVDLDLRFVRRADGLDLDYHYDRRRLRVRFEPPLPPHSPQTLTIGYSCDQPAGGIIFALPDDGYPDRPLHIHTQGQPELNRHWFFAHDHPNTRCTTEVIAAVPSGYQVLANGKQLAVEELPGGLTRWHYRLDQPHPTYLVSLVIGEFEIVREEWRGRPVEYWVPPGGSGDAPRTFGKTPRMMELFSTLLDSPYPYDKYAQSVVYLFQWGGMENTSATTLYESVLVSQRAALDEDAEDLIVHELAHQWFGDMVTCRSWDHLWLNEGFATYFEHVWNENEYGPDAYEYGVWRLLRGVAEADLDGDVGLSAPFSGDPDDLFGRSQSNPYSKGAAVIHALRRELGDEAFWACVREYLKEFSWREVESDDLRRVCERVTGLSLERFWTQWVRRGGAPRIKVFTDWDPDRGTLTIDLEQTQKIDADAPAFAADLDVWLVHADGTIERRKTPIERRFESLAIECREEPLQVCIDPRAAFPAIWDLGLLDHEMLLRTVTDGPTIHSRLTAMHALAQVDRPRVREVLSHLLGNQRAFWGLRSEAAAVLGKMNLRSARDKLLAALHDGLADLRVERAAVEALGGYRHPTVTEALLDVLKSGKSDRLMAAACDALARQASDPRIVAALRAAADHDSRDDRVRRSAVRALARLGASEGVAPARELARYGSPYRSRATGVAALGKLGHLAENTGEIRQFLIDLLDDPQDLAAGAAPGALVELGDPNAVAALERFAGGAAPRALRDAARDAAESLSRPDREAETIRALRRELDELKQRVRELEQSESG